MVWKFDVTSSGLVVDTVQARLEVIKSSSGQVMVSIFSDQNEEYEQFLEEGELIKSDRKAILKWHGRHSTIDSVIRISLKT